MYLVLSIYMRGKGLDSFLTTISPFDSILYVYNNPFNCGAFKYVERGLAA